MKFFSIFASNLYAVQYDKADRKQLSVPDSESKYKCHELDVLRKKWTNIEYLRDFYRENKKYFETEYWEGITIEDFVLRVIRNIPHIMNEIKQMCKDGTIDKMFKPLDNRRYKTEHHRLLEVKSPCGKIKGRLVLRIYALRLEKGSYLITGGAIKVTEQMGDHPLTKLEIAKINYTKAHLQNNGVFDIESFKDYKNC